MTRYAELMLASGRNYSVENHKKPEGQRCVSAPETAISSCPSLAYCPFNWYMSRRCSMPPSCMLITSTVQQYAALMLCMDRRDAVIAQLWPVHAGIARRMTSTQTLDRGLAIYRRLSPSHGTRRYLSPGVGRAFCFLLVQFVRLCRVLEALPLNTEAT